MSNKLGQEPAFPNDNTMDCQPPYCYGMSKRFYAACSAMQGIISNRELQIAIYSDASNVDINPLRLFGTELLIHRSYEYADELLKQENDEQG